MLEIVGLVIDRIAQGASWSFVAAIAVLGIVFYAPWIVHKVRRKGDGDLPPGPYSKFLRYLVTRVEQLEAEQAKCLDEKDDLELRLARLEGNRE